MEALSVAKKNQLVAGLHRDVRRLVDEVKQERENCLKEFTSAIRRGCNIGRKLLLIRNATEHGQWLAVLVEIGINKRTAQNYMDAARELAKDPIRVGYLIDSGAAFCAIWRGESIQKPALGGDYDPNAYQRRREREGSQLTFQFEPCHEHLDALIKAPNVEELSKTSREKLKQRLLAAVERLNEIDARENAIDLGGDEDAPKKILNGRMGSTPHAASVKP